MFSAISPHSAGARRSEYWYWVLFTFIAGAVASIVDAALHLHIYRSNGMSVGPIAGIVALIVLIPSIAVTIRRLHDTGRSGWWWLLSAICGCGAVIVFFFCLTDSQPGANQYGPNPKGM